MRVALIPHRYPPHLGGIERYAEELARGLARRGVDVDVLTPEPDASLPAVVKDGNLTVHRFHEPFSVPRYANAPALARRLRAGLESYDIVHVLNYHELVPLLAAFGNPRRLVVTPFYHPPAGGRAAPTLRRLHRAVAVPATRRADQIICISSAEAEAFVHEVPGIADRVAVIPAGVDVDAIRRAEPWNVTSPVVLSVGRLVGYKRVARVIESVALVGEEVDLVVIGDGPEAPALRAQAQSAGVAARFTGRLSDDDVRRWLRSATVVVTMSDRESFGLTVLEAAAAGARVVASDIPAHRETAALGGAGRSEIVAYADGAELLSAAIARAIAEGRPRAEAQDIPTWEGMADEMAEAYATVARRPGRARRRARRRAGSGAGPT